jgi:diaminopimelate decarboxylase
MSETQARAVREQFGTPVFVYDQRLLEARAKAMQAFPLPQGVTVRYAMKALPTRAILRIFDALGVHIDASSGFEAERALLAGIAPGHIQLTAQEIPANLAELLDQGVHFNACSLEQLRTFARLRPGGDVSIRVNPGLGSGHSNRTNVGGPSSSFGIWRGYVDEAKAIAAEHGVHITGMHTHIGSGADPEVWVRCADLALEILAELPEATRLSLGGGYKVARVPDEKTADIQDIGARVAAEIVRFEQDNNRSLSIEVEPGTYLVANAGAIVTSVIDVVDTGGDGYRFIKIDAGMTDILRPSMYGALHPIVVVPATPEERGSGDFVVVGHCCESGDILTPERGNPEALAPRTLAEAKVGDVLVIEGCGAYCAAQSAKNYNSFPEAPEVLLTSTGELRLIRKRQTLEQVLQNEVGV